MKRALAVTCAIAAVLLAFTQAARADIAVIGPVSKTFTSTGGTVAVFLLAGQSTCAMTLAGGGSATITPEGSSDGGSTYQTVTSIGTQTANGTYGAGIAPYLTNFKVVVSAVTGTVTVSQVCNGAYP